MAVTVLARGVKSRALIASMGATIVFAHQLPHGSRPGFLFVCALVSGSKATPITGLLGLLIPHLLNLHRLAVEWSAECMVGYGTGVLSLPAFLRGFRLIV